MDEGVSQRTSETGLCVGACGKWVGTGRGGGVVGKKYSRPYENIDYTFLRVHSLRRVLISRNDFSSATRRS